MFGKKIKLFDLLGFTVNIDLSWILIAVLIVWSFSTSLFPSQLKGLSSASYWLMGILGAAAFFASIVFHELCHSLVARLFGIRMKGITLFIFGGVAEMDEEPPSAQAEFLMAAAGPASSLVLSGLFWLSFTAVSPSWPAAGAVLRYLSRINLVLALFNLVFAFPLDGGRMLRSALWWWTRNLKWSTRISAQIGSFFGSALIAFGVISMVFTSNFMAGLWPAVLGMFLRAAARNAYQHLLTRRSLEGEPVRRFMTQNPVTVPPDLSLLDLVEQYIYVYHHQIYPVVRGGELVGCVTPRHVKEIPTEEWSEHTVSEVATPAYDVPRVDLNEDAMKALSFMNSSGHTRLLVMEGEHLAGIVTLRDLLEFLSLKIELEEGAKAL